MGLIALFWLEFWRVLLLPAPLPAPLGDDRPSAEIVNLAQWRSDHPERAA
jgi:hypothetical protein